MNYKGSNPLAPSMGLTIGHLILMVQFGMLQYCMVWNNFHIMKTYSSSYSYRSINLVLSSSESPVYKDSPPPPTAVSAPWPQLLATKVGASFNFSFLPNFEAGLTILACGAHSETGRLGFMSLYAKQRAHSQLDNKPRHCYGLNAKRK